jgi:multisubunit Na+/H+ antiporter MnhE subunit
MTGGEARRVGRRGAARAWIAWWLLLAALWLLLIDNTDAADIAAGALAAAIAATASVLVRGQRATTLRFRARWLRVLPALLASVARDLPAVARVVWARGVLRRPERGELVEIPFAAVGDDPEAAARRVLALTLGSVAPGTGVLDVDVERRLLRAHRLVASGDARRAADPLSALDDEGAQ